MTFQELPLLRSLQDAVVQEGYTEPTPIQAQAIPAVLEGNDVLGCAQTGTGKTAAFALPILHRLISNPSSDQTHGNIRALVLTPTRELAAQVGESFETYGRNTPIRAVTIFGGVKQGAQEQALRKDPQVLVATPGRLLDLIQQQIISLAKIEVFVLDEADRMLDLGFIHGIRRIVALLPEKRQSLFFSATMPGAIRALADKILTDDPVTVTVDPPASAVELIDQQLCFVEKREKIPLLIHFLQDSSVRRALVFSRTKYGADKIVVKLRKAGIAGQAIHGNKTQGARTRALENFRSGHTPVLVATDIAARGIDVEDITHVFNFDLPNESETYVHRIGRTARAGAKGVAIAFCAHEERPLLRDIELLLGAHLGRLKDYPNMSHYPPPEPTNLLESRSGSGGIKAKKSPKKRSKFGGLARGRAPVKRRW